MSKPPAVALIAICLLGVSACTSGAAGPPSATATYSGAQGSATAPSSSGRFPDVTQVTATRADNGTWTFDVTMTSPYDTPERYADGWRVKNGETVLGEMTLGHDHASEQPFTRTQTGVTIPDDVSTVSVQGHDQKNGYGGAVVSVELDR